MTLVKPIIQIFSFEVVNVPRYAGRTVCDVDPL